MDFAKLNNLKVDNLVLRQILHSDKEFIAEMFSDYSVDKYYVIPKEAKHDYSNLVSYWLNDIASGSGFAWIILEKGDGFFSKDKACGFFAFEFRDSAQNARISYAIKSEYRRKGIIIKSTMHIIDVLYSLGVTSIEADIDKDNLASEKMAERLGFTTNKRRGFIDPDMVSEGEIRFRYLWRKDLLAKPLNPISEIKTGRIVINAPQSELIEAIEKIDHAIRKDGPHPILVAKYHYLLGRIKFNEKNYKESRVAFADCNKVNMNEGLPENYETMYWFGRMRELEGKTAEAKMYYGFALEKFSADLNLITKEEILQAISKL